MFAPNPLSKGITIKERIFKMAFEEITADVFAEGAEEQEVTEPADEQTNELGAEDQEVTDPESEETPTEPTGKTEEDSKAAQWRREMESRAKDAEAKAQEAEAKLAEMQEKLAEIEAGREVMSNIAGNEEYDIAGLVELTGLSEEEVKEQFEEGMQEAQKEQELEALRQENQALKQEKAHDEAGKRIDDAVREIMEDDPTVKGLEDVDPRVMELFINSNGNISPKIANRTIKQYDLDSMATPPPEIGKVNTAPPERDWFTESEIASMTSKEKEDNWEKIMASLPKIYAGKK